MLYIMFLMYYVMLFQILVCLQADQGLKYQCFIILKILKTYPLIGTSE